MRILQISHAYPPTFGGVESHVQDLAHRLNTRGHEVTCLAGGLEQESRDEDGVRVLRRPELRVQTLLAVERSRPAAVDAASEQVVRLIRRALQAQSPDIVHVHNAHHFSSLLAQAILGEACAPVINTVHDRVGEYLRPEVLDLGWSHVLYVSHYLCEALPTSRRHSVVWLGIDLKRFTPDGPLDPRLARYPRPLLFHPARLLRWKGVHVSVAALALLLESGIQASLVLCGSQQIVDDHGEFHGYREELVAQAARLGVDDRVHFEVFEREHMDEAYRAADLVWYPTVVPEPLGLVPLEAMATGVPLVVSDGGGMRETVEHGRTGMRVPLGQPSALAAASRELLGNAALRSRITRAALQHSTVFGLDPYVDKVECLYRELAG
jgi:glycosyltransferase involved in cell wall biosynthesis